MSKSKQKSLVKKIKMFKPELPEYTVSLISDKDRDKFIKRIERIVRSSDEYKDYIRYLKDTIELDSCIFFSKISSNKNKGNKGHVSVELHHDPITLYDIVKTVLAKYEDDGLPLNDLMIADEVMMLHYDNEVGLVPVSKTAHEMLHNSDKLFVPLNMVYGEYSRFIDDYEKYVDDAIYDKIERKVILTKNMTPDQFDSITKELKVIDVDGYEEIEKFESKVTEVEGEDIDKIFDIA